jgi:O-antigen/teichoic acid export membrane protein
MKLYLFFICAGMKSYLNRIRKSEFLRNVFTLVTASSIAQAVSILIYPLLTRMYTPDDMGLFSLYLSIVTLTGIFSTGKYELAIMLPSEQKSADTLFSLCILIVTSVSLLLMVPAVFFRSWFSGFLGNRELAPWLLFVPLSTLLIGYFQVFQYRANRIKAYGSIASANLGQSLVNSGVKLGSSNLFASGGGLIAGSIAGQLAGLVVYLREWKWSEMKWKLNPGELWQQAARYKNFPRFNLLHYLVNNFSSSLPVFLFSARVGAAEAGFYSLGFMMVNRPMNLITASLTQVFSQRIIQKYQGGQTISTDVKKLVWRLFCFGLLPFILAGLLGPGLFELIFGEEWREAGRYMQVLLPWLFLVLLSSPLSFLPDMLNRQQKAMWIDVVKFILRALALTAGIVAGSAYTGLCLFGLISALAVGYNLVWYFQLSATAGQNTGSPNRSAVLKGSEEASEAL